MTTNETKALAEALRFVENLNSKYGPEGLDMVAAAIAVQDRRNARRKE